MARNREALVLLLDVGPSMHNVLPQVEKLCTILLRKKLIYRRTDDVGVVLFGTKDTDNELQKQVGGYEHIVIHSPIRVVDENLIKTVQKLPRGTVAGDYALHPVKDPYEGTKEDQLDIISQQMKAHGMKLDCIISRGKLSSAFDQRIMAENDHLLSQFSRKGLGKMKHVGNPTALLGAIRTQTVSSVAIFKGDFELTSTMKIKVSVYKKTSEERFPTLKKYSDKAPPTDKFATHEVKADLEYKSLEDANRVVPPEQRIRGYRYGPQVIPVSSEAWDAVKFKPEKGVKLLGFTDACNVMRHHYLKDVYIFIPDLSNKKASIAVSSLARAMKEMNKVAILRCAWRQNQGNVLVGVLTPNISTIDNMMDSFYFNVLPFAEDVREFQFPSFSSFPSSWQPSVQQQEAADNLVMMLDLAPCQQGEVLMPDLTPNPVLMRFYDYLELKSKNPDAEVPTLDPSLKQITEPDSDLCSQRKSVIDNFCNHFELKDNPKKKSLKRIRGEAHSTSREVVDRDNNGHVIHAENSSANKVCKIGDLTPVKDFEAMISCRDISESVTKAIKEMRNYIHDLLENSFEGDNYGKAEECLMSLRRCCILEQEPKEFNQFLCGLYERWKDTDLRSFFDIIASKNITPISKTEAADSDLTDTEAKRFPVKAEMPSH